MHILILLSYNLNWFTRLIPARCGICQSWPAQPLCADCVQRHAQPMERCRGCALLLPPDEDDGHGLCHDCSQHPAPLLESCHASLSYVWPWQGSIDAFKFHGQPALAGLLAARMAACPELVATVRDSDLLVPLPLHPHRLAERGFSQTWLLAQQLRRLVRPPVQKAVLRHDWLARSRHTPHQSRLPHAEREHNIQDAFEVPARLAPLVEGRHAVLLDDVMTTGATLEEAARVLLAEGCHRVSAVVLARTEKPRFD